MTGKGHHLWLSGSFKSTLWNAVLQATSENVLVFWIHQPKMHPIIECHYRAFGINTLWKSIVNSKHFEDGRFWQLNILSLSESCSPSALVIAALAHSRQIAHSRHFLISASTSKIHSINGCSYPGWQKLKLYIFCFDLTRNVMKNDVFLFKIHNCFYFKTTASILFKKQLALFLSYIQRLVWVNLTVICLENKLFWRLDIIILIVK